MEEKVIKNVIDYKYNDFEIGDEIEFGKWNKYYGNKIAKWTVLKKIDFSNLNEDDDRCLKELLGTAKDKYDGKALIVKMHDGTKVYYGVDFIKTDSVTHEKYLDFHFYNEWFDKENFPIVLNKEEDESLLKNQFDDGFTCFDGDVNWERKSEYLGKDLLFEGYEDSYKLLVYVGKGDDTDLYCNFNIDVNETTEDGFYKYSKDNLYFKTNTIMYCKDKCGCFHEVLSYDFQTKTKSTKKEYSGPNIEEYTAFDELYGWYREEILECLEECEDGDEDFFCGKNWYNIIELLIIKVKD